MPTQRTCPDCYTVAKKNNPCCSDITINYQNLHILTEDGVPDDLLVVDRLPQIQQLMKMKNWIVMEMIVDPSCLYLCVSLPRNLRFAQQFKTQNHWNGQTLVMNRILYTISRYDGISNTFHTALD